MTFVSALPLFLVAGVGAAAPGQFRFSTAHGDGMVLQSNPQSSTVWGFCGGGGLCAVTVTVTGILTPIHAVTSSWLNATIWMATIPPTAASFTPVDIVAATSDGRTATLQDVLFGDVWVSSSSGLQFSSKPSEVYW